MGVAVVKGYPHTMGSQQCEARGCDRLGEGHPKSSRRVPEPGEGDVQAGSLQHVRPGLVTDKAMWDPGDNPIGRSGKYTPQKSLLGRHTGVAGRIYHSSPRARRKAEALLPSGGSRWRGTAGPGVRVAAGTQAPQNPWLSLHLTARVPPPPPCSAESKEGGEGASGLSVWWQTCPPPALPFL